MAKRTFRQESTGGNCSRADDCDHNPRGRCRRVERAWLRACACHARFDCRVLRRRHFGSCDHRVIFRAANRERLCWRRGACSLLSAYAGRNLSARARVTRVRIRADLPEDAALTGALSKDSKMKSVRISDRSEQCHARDVLLLPIAVIAFWTLAYDLVLIARWPAQTITWCFLAIAIAGFFALGRLWRKTGVIPGKA